MDTIKKPLQVWVHLSADLTRNLLQLPTAPEQFQALQQKLRRARMAGVDGINFRRLLQRHGIDSSRFKH